MHPHRHKNINAILASIQQPEPLTPWDDPEPLARLMSEETSMAGGTRQNVLEKHELRKPDLRSKKPTTSRGTRQNMPKVHESGKPNPHKMNPLS